jgi:hypothetical protein
METIWPVTSFKLFIVHLYMYTSSNNKTLNARLLARHKFVTGATLLQLYVHSYILMTIGSVFFFETRTFVLQIKK